MNDIKWNGNKTEYASIILIIMNQFNSFHHLIIKNYTNCSTTLLHKYELYQKKKEPIQWSVIQHLKSTNS